MAQRSWAHPTGPVGRENSHNDLSCVGVCSNLDGERSQTGSQWPDPTHSPIQFCHPGVLLCFVVSMSLLPTFKNQETSHQNSNFQLLPLLPPASLLKSIPVGWAHVAPNGGQESGGGCGGNRHFATHILSPLPKNCFQNSFSSSLQLFLSPIFRKKLKCLAQRKSHHYCFNTK